MTATNHFRISPMTPQISNATLSEASIQKVQKVYRQGKQFRVQGTPISGYSDDSGKLPSHITWFTPDPNDSSKDQLFVENEFIQRSNWKFDDNEFMLSWQQGQGNAQTAGTFQMFGHNLLGYGHLSVGNSSYSAEIEVKPVTYKCKASANAGAYVAGKAGSLDLKWDPNSDQWNQATWEEDRFEFTYGLTSRIFVGQKEYVDVCIFKDNKTGQTWNVPEGEFSLLLTPDLRFVFSADSDAIPPQEETDSSENIKTVFPYLLACDFDGFAANFVGAMLTEKNTAQGVVYAIQGITTTWHGVGVQPQSMNSTTSSEVSSSLNIHTLLNMSQYQKDSKGNWNDVIQNAAMQEFYKILQADMDPDLRKKFISNNPPDLSAAVKAIADTPGTTTQDPASWYKGLSIPYLVNALSNSNMEGADTLNARRAQDYLKNATAVSDVFQVQAPLLYAYQWQQSSGVNGEIGNFKEDQKNNTAAYAKIIQNDVSIWKQEVQQEIIDAPEQLQKILDQIDALAKKGEDGCYWAYTFFRFATQPSALELLRMISLSKTSHLDGSAFTRRVQTNCAVLNLLDSSGFFVQEYTKVIQLFQIGNILPTLIDYGGDLNGYYFAVEEILQAFVEKYINSSDPQMAEQAQKLQEALAEKQVADVLKAYARLARTFNGICDWEQLAVKFEQSLSTHPDLARFVGKFGSRVAQTIALAAGFAGLVGFVFGLKEWDEMNAQEKTRFVITSVNLFTPVAVRLIKGSIVASKAFDPKYFRWQMVLGHFSEEALTSATTRATNGFAYWCIRRQTDHLLGPGKLAPLFEEAWMESEVTTTMKIFGRNLDEFVATRLGAMFAIANIVFSSIALAQSESDLETASNALFLASGALELFATGGAWALGAFGVETLGGLAVASIMSVLSTLAAVAAVAGVIILIIWLNQPQPTPVETFAKDQAQKAGYYMPDKVAIESFQVYQVKGQPQRSGITLEWNGDAQQCLQFQADGSLNIAAQQNNPSTAFFMATDYEGYATFSAAVTTQDGGLTMCVLTLDDSKALDGATRITDRTKVDQQKWVPELTGGIVWDGEYVQQANFTFYNRYWADQGVKLYLAADQSSVTTQADAGTWTVSMTSLEVAGLDMENIELYTFSRDQKFFPSLQQAGSQPKTWSVAPSLPSFMQLNSHSGEISQTTGVAPTLMEATSYVLSLSNPLNKITDSFSIEVKAAPEV